MGGSSSQRCTDPAMSLINAFPVKELYTLECSDSFKKIPVIGKNQVPTNLRFNKSRPYHRRRRSRLEHAKRGLFKAMMHPSRLRGQLRNKLCWLKVGLPFLKTASMVTRGSKMAFGGVIGRDSVLWSVRRVMHMSLKSGARDKDYINRAMIHYHVKTGLTFKYRHYYEVLKDSPKWQEIALSKLSIESGGGSKRHKSSGSSSFNTESKDACINLNTNAGDNNEDEVREIQRLEVRDIVRAAGKNKGSKASGSSTMNDDALARLMVTEMTAQKKEQCEAFLKI
nr:hypothetical protein [Tanacetum cinerariifolium]GEY40477.1 hypothetical protein [Tanacetum cinerariifolium]